MTAPRKPVAWTDPRGLERLLDGKQEVVSGKPTSAHDSVALYTAPDLQPLWALVEKWEKTAERFDRAGMGNFSDAADHIRMSAYELRTALEAL